MLRMQTKTNSVAGDGASGTRSTSVARSVRNIAGYLHRPPASLTRSLDAVSVFSEEESDASFDESSTFSNSQIHPPDTFASNRPSQGGRSLQARPPQTQHSTGRGSEGGGVLQQAPSTAEGRRPQLGGTHHGILYSATRAGRTSARNKPPHFSHRRVADDDSDD